MAGDKHGMGTDLTLGQPEIGMWGKELGLGLGSTPTRSSTQRRNSPEKGYDLSQLAPSNSDEHGEGHDGSGINLK